MACYTTIKWPYVSLSLNGVLWEGAGAVSLFFFSKSEIFHTVPNKNNSAATIDHFARQRCREKLTKIFEPSSPLPIYNRLQPTNMAVRDESFITTSETIVIIRTRHRIIIPYTTVDTAAKVEVITLCTYLLDIYLRQVVDKWWSRDQA